MSTEYRLAGRIDTRQLVRDPHELAAKIFTEWLDSNAFDSADLTPGRRKVGPNAILLSAESQPIDGSHTSRLQLRDTQVAAKKRFVVTMTVHTASPGAIDLDDLDALYEPDGEGSRELGVHESAEDTPGTWLQIDVDYTPLSDGLWPPAPAIPRLARAVLEQIPMLDGDVPLRSQPSWVGDLVALERLVEGLGSRRRHLPLLVAGEREHDTRETALDHYSALARHLTGYASMAVVSREMLVNLDLVLGAHLQIHPGQIRTFEPRPKPDNLDDARRHRLMGARAATADVRLAARTLASGPRRRALALALPPALATLRALGEETGRAAASAAAAAASTAVARASDNAAASLQDFSADAKRWQSDGASEAAAAADSAAVAALAAERDEARERAEALSRRLREVTESVIALQEQFSALAEQAAEDRDSRAVAESTARDAAKSRDDEIAEHDTTAGLLTAATDRIRYLEQRALSYSDYEAKHPTPALAETVAPAYLSDLVDRVADLEHVAFVADIGIAESLDEHLKASLYARRAWECLLAMDDYAQAITDGDWDRDFYAWCKEAPSGRRSVSANLVVLRESDTTMNQFGAQRLFSVPHELDATGSTTMEAHIRVGDGQPPAPRMHFYDDAKGKTGKIWIGYLGPHLPSRRTKNT